MPVLSRFPIMNLSWLGYNIAAGPLAHQGVIGIIPFVPLLVYMLIHVNYFEEYYFRKNSKRVVIWGFLHILMGVSLSAVFILLPLGFFYKYIYSKYRHQSCIRLTLCNEYCTNRSNNLFIFFHLVYISLVFNIIVLRI